MAWLGDWAKRVKLTIDSGDVDSALTWFPVLIHLSSSCGKDSQDLTAVFDELGANSLKLAVTQDDGLTELYVEIEEWDHVGEEAWLWTSLTGWVIASGSDTDLYLYYDATASDNTTYVSAPNDTPAEAVWDTNYKFVCHMLDDPDTSSTRDSTSNDNDGAKLGAAEPTVSTSGTISDTQLFDGVDDEVDCGNDGSLSPTTITVEAWVYVNLWHSNTWYYRVVNKGFNNNPAAFAYNLGVNDDAGVNNKEPMFHAGNGIVTTRVQSGVELSTSTWYHIVGTHDGTDVKIYLDGAYKNAAALAGNLKVEASDLGIGYDISRNDTRGAFHGMIDEVRISSEDRGSAWIKASYESQRDDFLSYGLEETRPVGGGVHRRRRRPRPPRDWLDHDTMQLLSQYFEVTLM